MFVIGNFITALANLVNFVLNAYMFIVIGRVIVSWVNADRYNPVVRFLYEVTEPLLARIRRVLPMLGGGLDFSPMILVLAIYFLQTFLVPTLLRIGQSLG